MHAHILLREGDSHIGREDGFWPEPLYSLGGSESDQRRAGHPPDGLGGTTRSRDRERTPGEKWPPTIGRGEREVIALGLEFSCLVVLDDRKARLRARHVGSEITGTLGILLRLHRIGLASRGIEEDLRMLEEAGTRISPDLRRIVIEAGRQGEGQQPRS